MLGFLQKKYDYCTTYILCLIFSFIHSIPSNEACHPLRIKVLIIFIFLLVLNLLPENPYVPVGYRVIIINTFQLFLTKLLRKEKILPRKTHFIFLQKTINHLYGIFIPYLQNSSVSFSDKSHQYQSNYLHLVFLYIY